MARQQKPVENLVNVALLIGVAGALVSGEGVIESQFGSLFQVGFGQRFLQIGLQGGRAGDGEQGQDESDSSHRFSNSYWMILARCRA